MTEYSKVDTKYSEEQEKLLIVQTKLQYTKIPYNDLLIPYIKHQSLLFKKHLVNDSYQTLLKQIHNISSYYNLEKPINTKLLFLGTQKSNKYDSSNIQINKLHLMSTFSCQDFYTALLVIQHIYDLLPQDKIILAISINKDQILTPKLIKRVLQSNKPELIDVTFSVILHELRYNFN